MRRLLLLLLILRASPALAGEVGGIVVLTSTTSSITPALVLRDRHVCGAGAPVHRAWLDLERGRLNGAVISLEASPQKRLAKQRVEIDQRNCTFLPRVVAMTIRSSIRFSNSDPVLHNVHLLDPNGRTVANWAMPARGQTTNAVALEKPGRYRVGCDAGHAWMNAHVLVFDHPYFAVSEKGGRFELGSVPAGRYRLVAWHPDLGAREATIVVPLKGRIEVRVDF